MGRLGRQDLDWEKIEDEYRAGVLSVSHIGRIHGCSKTAIQKRAKRDGWARDLAAKVRAKIAEKLVASEVASNQRAREDQIIEAAAATNVEVIRSHRSDIRNGRRLVSILMEQLERAAENREELEAQIEKEPPRTRRGSGVFHGSRPFPFLPMR